MISALLAGSRHRRQRAFDDLTPDRETAYAARDVLAFDSDATVRARAATFLARAPADVAVPALRDALWDDRPLVRHAAVRALGVQGDEECVPRLTRMVTEDPVWWVRRVAIVSASSLAGARAVPLLREALEDPFWRVRHAAVRALIVLGEAPGPATSERSLGALAYIRKRLGLQEEKLEGPTDQPSSIIAEMDPDPAVVTARVEAGENVSRAFLVACLGDAHEPLRDVARERLLRSPDPRALELALLWLEDPRIPHVAETVISLLDALEPEDATPLLDRALTGEAPGAACWASSHVALSCDAERLPALLRLCRSTHPAVRRVATAALGAFPTEDGAVEALAGALSDPDEDVVRAAAGELADHRHPQAREALARVPFDQRDPLLRRVLTHAAARRGDLSVLRRASHDADAHVRAQAIGARARASDLDATERERWAADPDPWVRRAVLDGAWAERVLAGDPQPALRRAAFPLVKDRARAASLASGDEDSWLRVRSTGRLDARRLLVLARDASGAVRAAAAEALERLDDSLITEVLRSEPNEDVRLAAIAHLSRAFDEAAEARLIAMRDTETSKVRAWIDDVLAGLRGERRTVQVLEARQVARPTRQLGATGIGLSPLIVSGVGNLPRGAYHEAFDAGCNAFFWEPRHRTLARVLEHREAAHVVTGTYHASEAAIVWDVERALRRLRRDVIDVFLLFWARSPARVDERAFAVLERLKQQGKIRALGFSTHLRDVACHAIAACRWDVVMTRHSAAHPGAEDKLLPLAREKNVGVLAFSALSYKRMLSPTIPASDAYRYVLSQPGVSACLSAPRTWEELRENLVVLSAPPLSAERQAELRAFGRAVHEESRDFAHTIRRHPVSFPSTVESLEEWLTHEDERDIVVSS